MFSHSTILAICAIVANTLALPQSVAGLGLERDPVGQDVGLSITFWESSKCHGKATSVQEALLNTSTQAVTDDKAIASYKLSRDMKFKNILEFSNSDGNTPCAKKLETTNPDSNGHPLLKDKCYTFSKGPTAKCFTYYLPGDYGSTLEPDSALLPQLLKRQEDTGVHLETWEELGCPGKPTATQELRVNINTVLGQNFVAYKVSRPMGSTELLDFSEADTSSPESDSTREYCAKFVERTNPMKGPVLGSSLLLKGHCYQLTGGVSARCAQLHY